jgi:sugar (pentulose or hexulose) kinase
MAGGGANSEVWCQIFADVLGRRIVVPAGSEFGAKGAAIVAGVGAGVFASHKDGVERTVTIVREYEPNLDKTAVYDRYFELYRRTREALQPLWNDLADASELTV